MNGDQGRIIPWNLTLDLLRNVKKIGVLSNLSDFFTNSLPNYLHLTLKLATQMGQRAVSADTTSDLPAN